MSDARRPLEGKVALVTGGSRGIGRSIARHLAAAGARVALTYHENASLAADVVSRITADGASAVSVHLSLPSRDSVRKALREIGDVLGPVDILVNNAGISQEKPFESITDDDWVRMIAVNLQGPFMCTQEVLPGMVRKNWGRIINISSVGGQWGGFNQVHYAAAKAGLINLTKSTARIYGRHGITANAIAIGLVLTDMSRREMESDEGRRKVETIPLGRAGEPEEVARVAVFLAGKGSAYVNGKTINVNGGMYVG